MMNKLLLILIAWIGLFCRSWYYSPLTKIPGKETQRQNALSYILAVPADHLLNYTHIREYVLQTVSSQNSSQIKFLEEFMHVTILTQITKIETIQEVISHPTSCKFWIKVGSLGLFEKQTYDVLRFEIQSNPENALFQFYIRTLKIQNQTFIPSYPYIPHLTIARAPKGVFDQLFPPYSYPPYPPRCKKPRGVWGEGSGKVDNLVAKTWKSDPLYFPLRECSE